MNLIQKKRLTLVIVLMIGIGCSVSLILYALSQNINAFLTPSELHTTLIPETKLFRLGGMVKKDSVKRLANLTTTFFVTDFQQEVPVVYQGILPDLFREGKGVVIEGRLKQNQIIASQVLAKHDENYMPAQMQKRINQK